MQCIVHRIPVGNYEKGSIQKSPTLFCTSGLWRGHDFTETYNHITAAANNRTSRTYLWLTNDEYSSTSTGGIVCGAKYLWSLRE